MGALSKCAKCPRPYCSRACQQVSQPRPRSHPALLSPAVLYLLRIRPSDSLFSPASQHDWKLGGHKVWCGSAGEKSLDYEIRVSPAKGLGLFAKRAFRRGEKILVERSVMTRRPDGSFDRDAFTNADVLAAAMALSPAGADIQAKFVANAAALASDGEEAGSGLFVNFSRVNHDCVGNTLHHYDPRLAIKMLVANRDIAAGSEITFSYVADLGARDRAARLKFRGFKCACRACRTPEISSKLDRLLELDNSILKLGSTGREDAAIRAGTALLKIYNQLQCSDLMYARTYYDMFQVAISRQQSLKQGVAFMKKGCEHALVFYGPEHEVTHKYRRYSETPSLHRNYRLLS